MKKISHYFKRSLQKMYLETYKKTAISRKFSDPNQKECIIICKKILGKRETEILLTPMVGKRYLKNESMGIVVTIDGSLINIINHVYSYTVTLDEKGKTELNEIIVESIEERRFEMEREIAENVKSSLKNIIKTFTYEKEEQSI
jgi:hypothetical protein